MRHLKSGRKLKRTSSHRRALLKNLASSLFEHKKIATTAAKAKELRPYAESLITKAKHALQNEQSNSLPAGQTVDIHNRRIVSRHIQKKAVLQELFDTIAPMVAERQGGYTRIIKTGFRRGDAGETAIIELVDWSAPQDGNVSKKKGKPARKSTATVAPKKVAKKVEAAKSAVAAATVAEPIAETPVVVEEPIVEAPVAVVEEVIEESPVAEETTELPSEEKPEEPA